ncbi:MAG: response regulator [Gemmataceae bacterium]|nr:response regulator [Gemmataceae bacterium]
MIVQLAPTETLPVSGVPTTVHNVLIVDDESMNRRVCRKSLESQSLKCSEAEDGLEALKLLTWNHFDLVLLDIDLPNLSGIEVLKQLRKDPPYPNLKIILFSGNTHGDDLARLMRLGADDYICKPFSVVQLRERVRASLQLKAAQDRSDQLNQKLLAMNHELEQGLLARDSDLVEARNALVLGLAELVGQRDTETGAHLHRIKHYSTALCHEIAKNVNYQTQVDERFIQMLECCAPLHDIGKVGIPDHILQKPGQLTPEERTIMQRHTIIAAVTLQKVAKQHPFAVAFLQMATEIARHHHERFDGTGYPDRLKGEEIPLSARIVAVADVYDALRSKRIYKPAFSHEKTLQIMLEESEGHFDPYLAGAFRRCHQKFNQIFEQFRDENSV